jgi:hypothetical protein
MIVGSSVDWTNVLVALIAGLPAIIAAIGVLVVHRQIRTPSGKSIGKQVEDTLHTSLSNNFHLQSIGSKVEAPTPPAANGEAAKVEALTDPEVSPDPAGA